MSEVNRREFLSTAVTAIAATRFGRIDLVGMQNMSFDAPKQIDAGVLNVGYAESGPANGRAVLLLHGWPYDIYTYADVAPMLAAKGYRVIVPYLRGYGTTRFRSSDTVRNGQPAALALDVIALLDGY